MTHPFDEFPLPWHDPLLQDLQAAIARSMPQPREVVLFLPKVPLDVAGIDFGGTGRHIARSVVNEAGRLGRMRDLVAALRSQDPALEQTIDEWMTAVPARSAPVDEGPPGDGWRGFSDDGGTERQIVEGHETLLDIIFLARGLAASLSVCHMRVKIGSKRYVGTGFRIADNLILTNHHVLIGDKDGVEEPASEIIAWFDFEVGEDGRPKQGVVIECDPDSVIADEARDWAVVKAVTPIPGDFPPLPIDAPVVLEDDDRVYIIQHPGGRPKMIGMHHNLVRFVDDDVVQYWTDTEGGSSGSPVFDKEWNVVALHHRWTSQEVDGRDEYRNQGQRIDKILADMTAAGVDLGG